MTGIRIRRAEPADQPRLIDICVVAHAQAFPGWPSDMATPADYEAQTRGEAIWVALLEGRPAGLASIYRREFLPIFTSIRSCSAAAWARRCSSRC